MEEWMPLDADVTCAKPTVLVLTKDPALRDVITHALDQRSMRYCVSDCYEDVDNNFCLIIAGPDMDAVEIGTKLEEIGGIPPCLLLLRNNLAETRPVRCSRCQTLILPMEIFRLPDALDRLLISD